jgi:hypothetical protein
MTIRDLYGDTSAREPTRKRSGIRYTADGAVYQSNPSEIVNRFEAIDASGDAFGNELPETDLPGFGQRYDDCGDDVPRFCADCGATHTVGRTCYRSQCPRCGVAWTRDRSSTIAAKLEATRRYEEAKREGWSGYKFHHLALSPPDGFSTFSHDPLDRTFDVLKEVLEELGASAGVIFYHPYRGEDGDDRGEWKGRLFSGREWEEDVREELEHSPHFHVAVAAKHIDGGHVTRAIEEETGWLVERITKGDSSVSVYDEYDLSRVVSYCLSHTGVMQQEGDGSYRAQYRYFGRTANLTPTDDIRAKMDAAVRSVAPNTLGLPWSSVACSEDRDGREPQSPLVGLPTKGDEVEPGEEPVFPADDGSPRTEGKCAGRLLNINKAPRFLEDAEWCEAAPHAEELREVFAEWSDEGDRPPPD